MQQLPPGGVGRRSLSAGRVRALRARTLLAAAPFVLTGVALMAFGLSMVWLSLHRLLGLIHFSPFIAVGAFLLCVGLLVGVVLHRSDTGR